MKKTKQILGILVLVVLLLACNKDDAPKPVDPDPNVQSDPYPTPENRPPGSFSLLAVQDNATDIDVLPEFSWEAATDPDGDEVRYELYVGSSEDAMHSVATDLGTTSYSLDDRLLLNSEYYWHVVAKDGKDKETTSSTYTFTTRNPNIPMVPLTTNANFSSRTGYEIAVFDGKLWLIGGTTGGERLSDVWFSENGIVWTLATSDAGFPPRSVHRLLVFDNKLWVIGGVSEMGFLNDVWYTENGSTWVLATSNANFEPRRHHAAAVFQDRLWVIGGITKDEDEIEITESDVWSSTDGMIWEPENLGAPFQPRWLHTATEFQNALWVVGGYDGGFREDIWSSEDGKTWDKIATNTNEPFTERSKHSTVVFANKLWVISGNVQNDAWHSSEGNNWEIHQELTAVIESAREYTAIVFDNRLWLINGETKTVWLID
jgi:hypothetical protein